MAFWSDGPDAHLEVIGRAHLDAQQEEDGLEVFGARAIVCLVTRRRWPGSRSFCGCLDGENVAATAA